MKTRITRHWNICFVIALLCTAAFSAVPAAADEDEFSVGLRGVVQLGNGKPGNDALGSEIYLRYPWKESIAFDLYYGLRMLDFEVPATRVLGLVTNDRDAFGKTTEIDSSARFHVLGVRAERSWRPFDGGRTSVFASAGLGLAYFTYGGVRGDLVGGGDYRVHAGSGWEMVPTFGAGLRYDLSDRLRLELGIQDDYHFGKVDVSATTTIDSVDENLSREIGNYNEFGFFLGLQYAW